MSELVDLRYPIGQYSSNPNPSQEQIGSWIEEIALFPERLKELTDTLSSEQLNWRYRPEGWMIKQVIHHCADSHLNSQMRFKLALTEVNPTIRPYFEDRWAELPDALDDDILPSVQLLTGLHKKWAMLLESLTPDQLQRKFVHPEHNRSFTLADTVGMYAWHGNHHLAHIKQAIDSEGSYK